MALQQALADTAIGAAAPNAYHRLLRVEVDTRARRCIITVSVFYDATASANGKATIEERKFEITGSQFDNLFGDPIKTRAYNYLKTLAAYSGAVDVP